LEELHNECFPLRQESRNFKFSNIIIIVGKTALFEQKLSENSSRFGPVFISMDFLAIYILYIADNGRQPCGQSHDMTEPIRSLSVFKNTE
jgi:hypothetical protein